MPNISDFNTYLYEDDSDPNIKYCLQSCNDRGDKKKYLMNDFRCVKKCPKPYNFLINNEICSDKCETCEYKLEHELRNQRRKNRLEKRILEKEKKGN